MIVSKANLQAVQVVKKDRTTPALYVLYVENDGSTYSVSQSALIGISPVKKEVKEKLKFLEEGKNEKKDLVIMHGDTVVDVLKNMPKDTLFKGILEHCNVDENGTTSLSDGKRTKTIKGNLQKMKPMPYKEIFKKALNNKQSVRSVVNISRLRALLEAVEKACGDQSGELPVYIEFSERNDIIIRAEHPRFLQRIIAIMTTYKGVEGQWLKENDWEHGLIKKKKKKLRLKLK